ncbi:unnamed protein product [Trichobilharzia regenti]|nr:unnamed protein product [Trichobilharzia regenti]
MELRVSVHTGTAYAIVLGRSRLGFDLIGDDVSYVSRLKYSAYRPGWQESNNWSYTSFGIRSSAHYPPSSLPYFTTTVSIIP